MLHMPMIILTPWSWRTREKFGSGTTADIRDIHFINPVNKVDGITKYLDLWIYACAKQGVTVDKINKCRQKYGGVKLRFFEFSAFQRLYL